MKKQIILTCKVDNNWTEVFNSEEEAYWFLYGLLSDVERYYHDGRGSLAFDVEDDCITWKQGKTIRYCAGWHWYEEQDGEKIIMPDGRSLISIFEELEMR